MAKQTISIGNAANDGTGDSLRIGADKVNDNFDEIYTILGDNTNTLYVGIVTQIAAGNRVSISTSYGSVIINADDQTPIIESNQIKVSGISTFGGNVNLNSDVTFTGSSANVVWDKSLNSLHFADNAKVLFGAGPDLEIYHDGSNSYIKDTGPGGIQVYTNEFQFRRNDGQEVILGGYEDGAIDLYYNGSKKFETTNTGVNVTGVAHISGNVGIGTDVPASPLHVKGGYPTVHIQRDHDTNYSRILLDNTGNDGVAIDGLGDGVGGIRFSTVTDGTADEKVRIDSSGKLGIGAANPASYISGGDNLVIAAAADAGLTIATGTSNTGTINFADGTSGDARYRGRFEYNHSLDALDVLTAAATALRIDSSGQLLVGTTVTRTVEDRVGNGPEGKIQIEAADSAALISIISAGTLDANRCGTLSLGRHRNSTVGGTPTIVQDNDALGAIIFSAGDGTDMRTAGASIHAEVDGTPGSNDMPGALILSTTADGEVNATERMRIASDGKVSVLSGLDVTGHTELDNLNVSGVSTFAGIGTFTSHLFVGGNLEVKGTTKFEGGTLTLGDSDSDNIIFGGEVDSNIIPDDDDAYDLGASTKEWRNIYVDGTAHLDDVNVSGVSTFLGAVNMTSAALTGTLTLQDNDSIELGTGSDLKLFHNGSYSILRNSNSSVPLLLESTGSSVSIQKDTGESMGVFNTDGSVELYYDNSKKIETTTTGVKLGNPATGNSNHGINLTTAGAIQIYTDNASAGSKNFKLINTSDVEVVTFDNAGSATFAGLMKSSQLQVETNSSSDNNLYGGNSYFGGTGDSSGNANASILNTGAATFADKVTTGGFQSGVADANGFEFRTTGEMLINSGRGSDVTFSIQNNGASTSASITGAGAATFTARSQIGTGTLSDVALSLYNDTTTASEPTLYIQNDQSGGNLLQGFGGGSEKVLITGAGAATFAGNTVVGDTSSTYVQLKPEGDIVILDSSGSTTQCFGISRVGDSDYSVAFTADGSATFSSYVQAGGNPNSQAVGTKLADWGTVFACNAATSTVFAGYTTSVADPKILLYGNGAATFAGNLNIGGGTANPSTTDGIEVWDYRGTNAAYGMVINSIDRANGAGFLPLTIGSSTWNLDRTGTGTFNGTIQSGGNPNSGTAAGTSINEYGTVRACQATGTSTVFEGYTKDTTTTTSSITAEGNATFVGYLRSKDADAASSTYVQTDGTDGITIVNANLTKATIDMDGDAQFDGSIQGGTGVPGGTNTIGTLINNGSIETQAASGNVFIGRQGSNGSATSTIGQDGNATFAGSLSKGSGSFKIPHPLPAKKDTHSLVHSFIEGPQADNIYSGMVTLVDGKAEINLDTAARMTEGTFLLLNTNLRRFVSNEGGWTAVKSSITGNVLTVEAQDNTCTDEVFWTVIGERKDQHMIDTEWTDENGRVITEPLKPTE